MEVILLFIILTVAQFVFISWLVEQEWMGRIWDYIVESINSALDAIKWLIGMPAAIVREYRRQVETEKKLHDALIDDDFLDRAARG